MFRELSLAALFGVTAGVPFFEPACAASRFITDTPALCYTFGVSFIVSYGGVVTWAGLRLADRIRSYSPSEKELTEKFMPKNNGFLSHIASNIFGAVACVPGVYLVYKYNTVKWFVFPTIVVDYILKTEGSYILLNALINEKINIKFCTSNIEKYKNIDYSSALNYILVSKLYPMISEKN